MGETGEMVETLQIVETLETLGTLRKDSTVVYGSMLNSRAVEMVGILQMVEKVEMV